MTNPSFPVFSLADVQRIAAEAYAYALDDFGTESPADAAEGLLANFQALMWDAAHEAGVEGAPECFRGAAARFRDSRAQEVV